MRYHLCSLVLVVWALGLIPLWVSFFMSLSWDHRFGHPPVGFWIFTVLYVLAGWPICKGVLRNRPKADNAQP